MEPANSKVRVSIIGASGYTGGELIRLLLSHPYVEVAQVTSQQNAGKFISSVHPNFRGQTQLKFTRVEEVGECDVLFLALPHGRSTEQIEHYAKLAPRIIDLAADFRLRDPQEYKRWYEVDHANVAWLNKFCYGLPETRREELRKASYVSGVGCNATTANLAMLPLARAGLIRMAVCDLKVGSSEGGNQHSAATHHATRAGSYRSFAPVGHRHQAEIRQELGDFELHFSVTAVEMVRGVLCTAHLFLHEPKTEKDLWKIFRAAYGDEPFVRIVNDKQGLYRLPEPKLVTGTNYCDVGFRVDESSGRVVVISALDNLMKGAAGTAVQCMNLMLGWPERTALDFMGLHPI
ncbi:MAG TPA: N-acetyl-gamma-glutamyl-phosphate reductase [Pirellulaceae bacterium]|nr:N-acetyl-gamma-glutamyl-phosphate reductase [Pirellulaceae bacterium]HMO92118.1 N-acetyl-gamma-glutamyl-phosphate reductase [Pirellulaceae bacterium]HMP69294.1 N-acetyl-gamma-glutamyl-phosphate reductase [Pirellulaceae bacterium]